MRNFKFNRTILGHISLNVNSHREETGKIKTTWKYIATENIPIHHKIFQKSPKNLDLSYKTDLDLWDGLGRV